MAVENKMKKKAKKLELILNSFKEIEAERQKIQESLKYLDAVEHELTHELDHIEDYLIDHYAQAEVRKVELMEGQSLDIVVVVHGTTTYASYNNLVCTAKTHPDDEYVPEIGKLIAVQRLINRIIEINFNIKL